MDRWNVAVSTLAAAAAVAATFVLAACDTEPRSKITIKRASDYEPVIERRKTDSAATGTASSSAGDGESRVVKIGLFTGHCDNQLKEVTEAGLVVLTGSQGVSSFRLAGIAMPSEVARDAIESMRASLSGDAIGVEVDPLAAGTEPAGYVFRCSDGTMVNEELVRHGLAVPDNSLSKHGELFQKASIEALKAGVGVWKKPER